MSVSILYRLVFFLIVALVPTTASAMCWLKQSSAIDLKMGPFTDSSGAVLTGLTLSQADVLLAKGSGAFAQKNDATACTHDANGIYECPLNATDTGTVGRLAVSINESGALPVWKDCMILTANAHDAMIDGTGVGVRADVRGWVGGTPNALASGRVDVTVGAVQSTVTVNTSDTGTAQAGCGAPCATITLATSASTTADLYKDQTVLLTGGTGAGQTCTITAYSVGRVVTCSANWRTAPDGTTTYAVIGTGPGSATVAGNVTVGGYAAGEDPATYILTTPANTLTTDASGRIQVQAGTGTGQVDLSSGRIKDDKPAVGRIALKKGTTSYLGTIYIEDQRTGAGLTGLAFNTASLTAYYTRADQGDTNAAAITLATAARGTFTSSGFIEKDATNAPGWYEFGVPNAVLASGSSWATVTFKGAANMKPATMFIELVDNTVQDISTTLGTPAGASISADIASVQSDTNDLQNRVPAALVGGRMDSDIGAISTDATAANNLEALLDGTGGVTLSGTLSGSVGSVAAGGITSATFAAGAIDAAAIAGDAITAAKLAADVGTEIATATAGTTLSELSQATPSATPTLAQAIMLMYMALRNQTDTTSGQISYTNDAGTVIVKCTLADNGVTFTKSECVAGP
jgi:hypothetical protein